MQGGLGRIEQSVQELSQRAAGESKLPPPTTGDGQCAVSRRCLCHLAPPSNTSETNSKVCGVELLACATCT